MLLGSVKTSEAFLCLQPHCPGCTSRSAKRLDWISDSIPSWNDRDTVPLAAHARFVQLEAFAGASTVRPGPSTQSEFTNIKEEVTSRCRFTNVKKSVYLNMSVSNGLKLLTSIYLSWDLRAHWQVGGLCLRTKTSTIKIWVTLSHLPTLGQQMRNASFNLRSGSDHGKYLSGFDRKNIKVFLWIENYFTQSGYSLVFVTRPGWNQIH